LKVNEILKSDETLTSSNGRFVLKVQLDGKVTLMKNSSHSPLWTSPSERLAAQPVQRILKLQPDGNLVLVDAEKTSLQRWSTETAGLGNETSVFVVRDDASAAILSDGKEIWQTEVTQRTTAAKELNGLKAGESLEADEAISTGGGPMTTPSKLRLVMGADGNLILLNLRSKGVVWSAGTQTTGAKPKLTLTTDGNVVVFDGSTPKWSTKTAGRGNSGSTLKLHQPGKLVLLSDKIVLWEMTLGPELSYPKIDRLPVGSALERGQCLTSPNGKFKLTMGTDGNCVLRSDTEVWSSKTAGVGQSLVVQDNDNLVITGSRWSSKTRRRQGGGTAVLLVRDDGKLALKSGETIIWSNDPKLIQRLAPMVRDRIKRCTCVIDTDEFTLR
jgi:hypothetical protein